MNKSIVSLTSLQNDMVKAMAALLEKKHRERTGQFLIEGVHLVHEALLAGADVQTVVYDAERGIPPELKKLLQDTHCGMIEATPGIMAKCTGTNTPPPIFGIVVKPRYEQAAALFKEQSLVVVLDGVRDPGNVGTIIRSADAVGADAVVLGRGSVDLYNPKTVRSTMGSLFHLPIIEGDLEELMPEAKKHGIRLVGTSLQATSTCYGYNWNGPTWLLLGNESNGLSPWTLEQVDESVIIPMHGRSESLNVAMAGTVLLYEALRQRQYSKD